jgi:hypothetical protein
MGLFLPIVEKLALSGVEGPWAILRRSAVRKKRRWLRRTGFYHDMAREKWAVAGDLAQRVEDHWREAVAGNQQLPIPN